MDENIKIQPGIAENIISDTAKKGKKDKKIIPPEKQIKKLKRKVLVQGISIFLLVLACAALFVYSFRDEIKFRYAVYQIDNGEVSNGLTLLNDIPYHKGVSEILNKYKFSNIGSTFVLGTYEQDGNSHNGSEDLEWVIIDFDADANKALITTKYCIDCKVYKDAYGAVTWETSDVRSWLNGRFIEKTFSEEEKALILDTNVVTPKNVKYGTDGGNTTVDKVFLLSDAEFQKYLSGTDYVIGYTTQYARDKGVQSGPISGTSVCWLRSPGESLVYISTISYVGELNSAGVYSYSASCGIRPTMWIDASN